MMKHVIENGKNTKEPQAFCRLGKVMPIKKLQLQEDKLPIDMATGRGDTSKSSKKIHYIYLIKKNILL